MPYLYANRKERYVLFEYSISFNILLDFISFLGYYFLLIIYYVHYHNDLTKRFHQLSLQCLSQVHTQN